jgi:pimeloyl-ACP methyl ester carboxylesterase
LIQINARFYSDEQPLRATIAEFQRIGFHGALNYYRAVQPYFDLCGAYRGAKITQPAYFMWGKSDGLYPIYQLTEAKLRDRLPSLAGYVGLDGVGHWVQHEATDQVSQHLVTSPNRDCERERPARYCRLRRRRGEPAADHAWA